MTSRLFRDDLESTSFSKWNGTSISAGETLVVQKDFVHHGGFAARATCNGSAVSEGAYCYHDPAVALSELYARLYMRFVSHDLTVLDDRLYTIFFMNGVNLLAGLGWRYNLGPTVQWTMIVRNGAAYVNLFGGSPVVGQWYCAELYWKEDAAAGIGRVFIDGKLILERTAVDTADYGSTTRVRMGIAEANNTVVANVLFDCCLIDNKYIGMETPQRMLKPRGGDARNKCSILSTRRGGSGFTGLK